MYFTQNLSSTHTLKETDFIHDILYDLLSSFDDASVHIVCEVLVDLGGLLVDGLVEGVPGSLEPLPEVDPRKILRDAASPQSHHLCTLPKPIHE